MAWVTRYNADGTIRDSYWVYDNEVVASPAPVVQPLPLPTAPVPVAPAQEEQDLTFDPTLQVFDPIVPQYQSPPGYGLADGEGIYKPFVNPIPVAPTDITSDYELFKPRPAEPVATYMPTIDDVWQEQTRVSIDPIPEILPDNPEQAADAFWAAAIEEHGYARSAYLPEMQRPALRPVAQANVDVEEQARTTLRESGSKYYMALTATNGDELPPGLVAYGYPVKVNGESGVLDFATLCGNLEGGQCSPDQLELLSGLPGALESQEYTILRKRIPGETVIYKDPGTLQTIKVEEGQDVFDVSKKWGVEQKDQAQLIASWLETDKGKEFTQDLRALRYGGPGYNRKELDAFYAKYQGVEISGPGDRPSGETLNRVVINFDRTKWQRERARYVMQSRDEDSQSDILDMRFAKDGKGNPYQGDFLVQQADGTERYVEKKTFDPTKAAAWHSRLEGITKGELIEAKAEAIRFKDNAMLAEITAELVDRGADDRSFMGNVWSDVGDIILAVGLIPYEVVLHGASVAKNTVVASGLVGDEKDQKEAADILIKRHESAVNVLESVTIEPLKNVRALTNELLGVSGGLNTLGTDADHDERIKNMKRHPVIAALDVTSVFLTPLAAAKGFEAGAGAMSIASKVTEGAAKVGKVRALGRAVVAGGKEFMDVGVTRDVVGPVFRAAVDKLVVNPKFVQAASVYADEALRVLQDTVEANPDHAYSSVIEPAMAKITEAKKTKKGGKLIDAVDQAISEVDTGLKKWSDDINQAKETTAKKSAEVEAEQAAIEAELKTLGEDQTTYQVSSEGRSVEEFKAAKEPLKDMLDTKDYDVPARSALAEIDSLRKKKTWSIDEEISALQKAKEAIDGVLEAKNNFVKSNETKALYNAGRAETYALAASEAFSPGIKPEQFAASSAVFADNAGFIAGRSIKNFRRDIEASATGSLGQQYAFAKRVNELMEKRGPTKAEKAVEESRALAQKGTVHIINDKVVKEAAEHAQLRIQIKEAADALMKQAEEAASARLAQLKELLPEYDFSAATVDKMDELGRGLSLKRNEFLTANKNMPTKESIVDTKKTLAAKEVVLKLDDRIKELTREKDSLVAKEQERVASNKGRIEELTLNHTKNAEVLGSNKAAIEAADVIGASAEQAAVEFTRAIGKAAAEGLQIISGGSKRFMRGVALAFMDPKSSQRFMSMYSKVRQVLLGARSSKEVVDILAKSRGAATRLEKRLGSKLQDRELATLMLMAAENKGDLMGAFVVELRNANVPTLTPDMVAAIERVSTMIRQVKPDGAIEPMRSTKVTQNYREFKNKGLSDNDAVWAALRQEAIERAVTNGIVPNETVAASIADFAVWDALWRDGTTGPGASTAKQFTYSGDAQSVGRVFTYVDESPMFASLSDTAKSALKRELVERTVSDLIRTDNAELLGKEVLIGTKDGLKPVTVNELIDDIIVPLRDLHRLNEDTTRSVLSLGLIEPDALKAHGFQYVHRMANYQSHGEAVNIINREIAQGAFNLKGLVKVSGKSYSLTPAGEALVELVRKNPDAATLDAWFDANAKWYTPEKRAEAVAWVEFRDGAEGTVQAKAPIMEGKKLPEERRQVLTDAGLPAGELEDLAKRAESRVILPDYDFAGSQANSRTRNRAKWLYKNLYRNNLLEYLKMQDRTRSLVKVLTTLEEEGRSAARAINELAKGGRYLSQPTSTWLKTRLGVEKDFSQPLTMQERVKYLRETIRQADAVNEPIAFEGIEQGTSLHKLVSELMANNVKSSPELGKAFAALNLENIRLNPVTENALRELPEFAKAMDWTTRSDLIDMSRPMNMVERNAARGINLLWKIVRATTLDPKSFPSRVLQQARMMVTQFRYMTAVRDYLSNRFIHGELNGLSAHSYAYVVAQDVTGSDAAAVKLHLAANGIELGGGFTKRAAVNAWDKGVSYARLPGAIGAQVGDVYRRGGKGLTGAGKVAGDVLLGAALPGMSDIASSLGYYRSLADYIPRAAMFINEVAKANLGRPIAALGGKTYKHVTTLLKDIHTQAKADAARFDVIMTELMDFNPKATADATQLAWDSFCNQASRNRVLETASRNIAAPMFLTYQVKMVPRTLRIISEKPMKALAAFHAWKGIQQELWEEYGDEDVPFDLAELEFDGPSLPLGWLPFTAGEGAFSGLSQMAISLKNFLPLAGPGGAGSGNLFSDSPIYTGVANIASIAGGGNARGFYPLKPDSKGILPEPGGALMNDPTSPMAYKYLQFTMSTLAQYGAGWAFLPSFAGAGQTTSDMVGEPYRDRWVGNPESRTWASALFPSSNRSYNMSVDYKQAPWSVIPLATGMKVRPFSRATSDFGQYMRMSEAQGKAELPGVIRSDPIDVFTNFFSVLTGPLNDVLNREQEAAKTNTGGPLSTVQVKELEVKTDATYDYLKAKRTGSEADIEQARKRLEKVDPKLVAYVDVQSTAGIPDNQIKYYNAVIWLADYKNEVNKFTELWRGYYIDQFNQTMSQPTPVIRSSAMSYPGATEVAEKGRTIAPDIVADAEAQLITILNGGKAKPALEVIAPLWSEVGLVQPTSNAAMPRQFVGRPDYLGATSYEAYEKGKRKYEELVGSWRTWKEEKGQTVTGQKARMLSSSETLLDKDAKRKDILEILGLGMFTK